MPHHQPPGSGVIRKPLANSSPGWLVNRWFIIASLPPPACMFPPVLPLASCYKHKHHHSPRFCLGSLIPAFKLPDKSCPPKAVGPPKSPVSEASPNCVVCGNPKRCAATVATVRTKAKNTANCGKRRRATEQSEAVPSWPTAIKDGGRLAIRLFTFLGCWLVLAYFAHATWLTRMRTRLARAGLKTPPR